MLMLKPLNVMKKTKLYLIPLLLMGFVVGCNGQDRGSNANEEIKMEKPDQLGMNKDSLEVQVQQQAVDAREENRSALVAEAVAAIDNVQSALSNLEKKDKEAALADLEAGTGKLEILMARDPNLAFVPIDASVKTVDLVADLETIKMIKEAVREAIEDNYFQTVREEAANLASELQITTVEMPLATFPTAMKLAASMIERDSVDEAKIALYTAMNTLVVKEERIPLPILRAQAMIDQAKSDDASDEDKKKEVLQLLDNAEYQLTLAEELGYGKRDKEYAELNKAIKELKKSVKDDGDSQGLFDSLKTKLSNFRKRIAS